MHQMCLWYGLKIECQPGYPLPSLLIPSIYSEIGFISARCTVRNSPTAPKKCSKKFECVGWMSTESSRTSKTSGCFVQVRERGSCPNRKNLQHYDPNTLYQFLRILFSCIQSQLLERRFGTVSNVKTPAVHSITSPFSLQYLRNKCCLCLNVYPKEYNDSWGLFRQATAAVVELLLFSALISSDWDCNSTREAEAGPSKGSQETTLDVSREVGASTSSCGREHVTDAAKNKSQIHCMECDFGDSSSV